MNKLFLKRNTYYRKIENQRTLFDEASEEIVVPKNIFTFKKEIKVPVEELEFRYGSIAFKCLIQETKVELEFEIQNLDLRPEFEVLKPYFSKALKSKNIKVSIQAEFENNKLVSQLATSADVKRINREVIEGVKFKFITKHFLRRKQITEENPLTKNELKEGNQELYSDGQELLEDILKHKDFKHSQQLRFLANTHEGAFIKIRFVLSPFSFVFLLSGEQQFHIILETLDTEEATYLWHTDKNRKSLVNKVKEIDQQLNIIRNKGREAFLDTNPENFSKILHDYSDKRKGFVIWKDLLEEQIV